MADDSKRARGALGRLEDFLAAKTDEERIAILTRGIATRQLPVHMGIDLAQPGSEKVSVVILVPRTFLEGGSMFDLAVFHETLEEVARLTLRRNGTVLSLPAGVSGLAKWVFTMPADGLVAGPVMEVKQSQTLQAALDALAAALR